MKKLYAIALLFLTAGAYAQVPEFRWAFAVGDTSEETLVHFVTDTAGNIYVTGHFTGTTDFDPGPGIATLTSHGDSDIFVAKYAKDGELLWDFGMGGPGPDEATGIVLHNDLFYITGSFSDSMDFDPILGGAVHTSHGSRDIFICNFDTTGFLIWVNTIGALNMDLASAIAIDDSGNIALTGSFQGNVDFDPGLGSTILQTGGVPSDAFVAKYTEAGALRWAYDFGSGTLADAGIDVAFDDSGNVFNVGQFQQTNIDFDPSLNNAYLTSHGGYDAYVASYTRDGAYRWAFNIGGSVGDRCNSIAIDTANEVLITGRFSGLNVDFDPGPGSWDLNANSNSDIFVAKYTNAGAIDWAYQIGSAGNEEGMDITANPYNNYVVATGLFSGTVDFNPGGGVNNMTANAGDDAYVVSFEPGGAYAWSFDIGGSGADAGTQVLSFLDVDSLRLYVAGTFMDSCDFDPGATSHYVRAHGSRHDIFLAQYRDPYIVGIPEVPGKAASISSYPNPASGLVQVEFSDPARNGRVEVLDMQGALIMDQRAEGTMLTLNVGRLANGLYILKYTGTQGSTWTRFAVSH